MRVTPSALGNQSFSMYFASNSMVSSKDITRRFRIHNYILETWMEEGLIPQCVWHNRRRYWSSDDFNALIAGCPVTFSQEAASSIKSFSRRPVVLDYVSAAVALVVTLASR